LYGRAKVLLRSIMSKAGYVKEVFLSLQGEGKYAGARQLFVRFCGCSVGCRNCDTDYSFSDFFLLDNEKIFNPVSPEILCEKIFKHFDLNTVHSVAITGGEPLDQLDFLKHFSLCLKNRGVTVFLETSGFYPEKLQIIKDVIDIFSIDIKINSTFSVNFSSNLKNFLTYIDSNISYVKLIISETIKETEIISVLNLLRNSDVKELYLQPLNNRIDINKLEDIMLKFYKAGIKAYFMPQLHKFLEIQ